MQRTDTTSGVILEEFSHKRPKPLYQSLHSFPVLAACLHLSLASARVFGSLSLHADYNPFALTVLLPGYLVVGVSSADLIWWLCSTVGCVSGANPIWSFWVA